MILTVLILIGTVGGGLYTTLAKLDTVEEVTTSMQQWIHFPMKCLKWSCILPLVVLLF